MLSSQASSKIHKSKPDDTKSKQSIETALHSSRYGGDLKDFICIRKGGNIWHGRFIESKVSDAFYNPFKDLIVKSKYDEASGNLEYFAVSKAKVQASEKSRNILTTCEDLYKIAHGSAFQKKSLNLLMAGRYFLNKETGEPLMGLCNVTPLVEMTPSSTKGDASTKDKAMNAGQEKAQEDQDTVTEEANKDANGKNTVENETTTLT